MNSWSSKSLAIRDTLDPDLIWLVDTLLQYMDCSLISGHRGEEEQNLLRAKKVTQVRYPNSKHNVYPSRAVDINPYPYPDNENDLRAALGYMAGLCMILSEQKGFTIRWGGDWNQNGTVTDNGFDDLFHMELV